jgi:hypothetical protein
MTTYVINGTDFSLPVEIEYPAEGSRKDDVYIQAKSKAKLPAMSRVTSAFLSQNPRVSIQRVDDLNEPLVAIQNTK